jgi:DNA-binding PadR family transcriptional regulator
MISEWLQRISSSIPRGFSRYYILSMLSEKPMTGKEIIDEAARRSKNQWKPSPGLVYPLLGKLMQEGLIDEVDGRYMITDKGRNVLADANVVQDIIKRQLDVVMRLSNLGIFLAKDILDRVISLGSLLAENIDKMSRQERERYKAFLLSQLRKIEESESKERERERINVE